MSDLALHLQPPGTSGRRGAGPSRHWPRRLAVGTVSIGSLLVALSAVAYRSFADLPT